jgi:hypothetical protein
MIPNISALKMVAACFSEMLASTYGITTQKTNIDILFVPYNIRQMGYCSMNHKRLLTTELDNTAHKRMPCMLAAYVTQCKTLLWKDHQIL